MPDAPLQNRQESGPLVPVHAAITLYLAGDIASVLDGWTDEEVRNLIEGDERDVATDELIAASKDVLEAFDSTELVINRDEIERYLAVRAGAA